MVRNLLRFEWRLLWADRTMWALVLLFAGLTGYGLSNGLAWIRFQQDTIDQALEEEEQRYAAAKLQIATLARGDSIGVKPWLDPTVPSVAGGTVGPRYAVLPPAPLGALAVGQSDLYPYYAKVSTRLKQRFVVNDEIENPVHLLAGRLDLAFVVVFLYPLIVLALTYNLISSEREQGTLALLLSQSVAIRRVLLAKVLVRAMLVTGLTVGVVGLGSGLGAVDLTAPGAGARLLLCVGILLLYCAFWFVTALAVNTFGRGSATNAVILLALWLIAVVLVPSLYSTAVTTLRPSPSRVELTVALRQAGNAASEQGAVLLQQYYQDHPELMPTGDAKNVEDLAARTITVTEATERSLAPTLAAFDQQLAAQQALADRYRFVSPAIVVQAALADIAGTGPQRHRHFQTQVDRFQEEWRRFFAPRVFARTRLTSLDYDAFPRFRFEEEAPDVVLRRLFPSVLGLLVPTVLIAALALGRLGRVPLGER